MSDARLNPVAWTEGMFLRPHHMQQHELSIQGRLEYYLRAIDPFYWGVSDFALNEGRLAVGRIEISRLEMVLPGGTIVRYPHHAIVASRDIPANLQSADVYVGVRQLSPMQANSAPYTEGEPENGARAVRYLMKSESPADFVRGGFERPVNVLLPNVRVFFGDEPEREQYDALRLCRVEATGDSKARYVLSKTASPPLLRVQAYPALEAAVRESVARVAAKLAVLATRTEGIALPELPRLMMRYTLARMVPVLESLLSDEDAMQPGRTVTRPFALYAALVETAGALATFRYREAVKLPRYVHQDPWPCFAELITFIDRSLGETDANFVELKMPYNATRRAYVTSELSLARVDARNRFTLAIQAKMESAQLIDWVVRNGKLAAPTHLAMFVERALPGIKIERLAGQPHDIAGPPGAEYFKLEPYGDQWTEVTRQSTLALSLAALTDADVRLYIVMPGS